MTIIGELESDCRLNSESVISIVTSRLNTSPLIDALRQSLDVMREKKKSFF